ncbi:hypothetical protein SAY86_009037 [Trapa natans]|uniref:Glycosyl transferase CAP10 domain-containing protein n=1 Tax=Trapa natans TaxID=22666 RepID=A0AAN7KAC0_TRANT|nr:hypothetical protein SAY86_009037 [Trapa natans]
MQPIRRNVQRATTRVRQSNQTRSTPPPAPSTSGGSTRTSGLGGPQGSPERPSSPGSRSHFRLVVYKGKAYLEQFHRAWQTRGVFTLWGILQLLRLYPVSVPDLEMMFCCEDLPALPKRNNQVPEGAAPSAMFHYCGEESAFDIPFPDWSFWGWIGLFLEYYTNIDRLHCRPEVNIKPLERAR